MAGTEKTEKKKMNPILWFLFAIVIPLIIVVVIIAVVLSFTGFNVIDWAKEKGSTIPVVQEFIPTPEEVDLNREVELITRQVEKKEVEIEDLQTQIVNLEQTITNLEQELVLQEEIINKFEAEAPAIDVETLEVEGAENQALKTMAKTLEEMKPANAASILSNMVQEEVIILLRELPNDVRGDILQLMDVELAASITSELME